MENHVNQQVFYLADWQVKPGLSVIEKDGEAISLEPRVMALLVILASKPGDVFSRQDLEEQVWQGTVVGYDALSKAINKLREALGDDKKDPRFIQTISKKGYRLVANVSDHPPHQPAKAIPANNQETTTPWFAIISAMIVILIVMLILIYIPSKEAALPSTVPTAQTQDTKPTIVVLPFRNISPSDKDDYLADGLTSDLTTNLSKLSSLWVTASRTSRVYKHTELAPEKIKQTFNARYVISGDVNKIGQSIRINVHLTDLISGNILWSERYDRQFDDLFAIQDEVTQKILSSLSLTLTKEEKQRIAKRYTNNLDAYEIFLRAQFLLNARTPVDNIRARDLYKEAIELDPAFARAYAGMSYSYSIGYVRQWPADTKTPLDKAIQYANQAITLGKDLPEGYWSAALAYIYQNDTDKGDELLEKIIELNPNYADAYALYATSYTAQGKPEDAIKSIAKAYRLNPEGGFLYELQLGRAYYFMDNYDLAYETFLSSLERNPSFIDIHMYLAATYVQLGRYDEAGWMFLEAKTSNPDFNPKLWVKLFPFIDGKGYREKLLKDIALAESYSRNQ